MKRTVLVLGLSTVACVSFAQSFSEGFDSVAGLSGSGWVITNKSEPAGVNSWFQGTAGVFPAHSGAATSYIGANFNSVGANGTLSNWLITPERSLNNGDTISFWTRTVDSPLFPDRLEVRMSTAGSSTDVGANSTTVGVFSNLLLTINPNLTTNGYPNVWTQFNATVSGLGAPTNGRFAFRYFVTNAGPNANNSDYIGIDDFNYVSNPVPEPATMAVLGLGAMALIRRRRSR